ncbi:hypothetical protein PTSG_07691 [Salpingoeca rosetta]|uniref:CWH43-like N-terminal domain-containing protein n=1 Tax=Salpingoeca rosetta (strain ATCC 50818 / BSB-021) TaxID=946362 RepID=F2UHH5_SALR5|nr:uncharacterized protein PTSG_07691 [Salpingoeca rosetta]EGD76574.1 hypothetical protein PTSG_07691 [Salpingoeca rosetta]|eukprot:XP_004991488.1 hypothetical protein PTSG_07691 [Salpingoeca rosetta]
MARFRAAIPLIACGIAITTIILCFIISQSLGHDTGGLTWPYVSDTGRDDPEHIVFAIGLTVAAVFYVVTWKIVVQYVRSLFSDDEFTGGVKFALGAVLVLQILAAIGLALLAIFDTLDYPTVHLISAILFFVLSIIATTIVTVVYYRRAKHKDDDSTINNARFKLAVLCIIWILFIIYIPIGLPLADYEYDDVRTTDGTLGRA